MACGGNAECCTCHVYLTRKIVTSQDYIEPKTKEIDALDWAEGELTDESRLACQTKVSKSFEGQTILMVDD